MAARAAGDSWHVYPVGLAVFAADLASANTPVFHGISSGRVRHRAKVRLEMEENK